MLLYLLHRRCNSCGCVHIVHANVLWDCSCRQSPQPCCLSWLPLRVRCMVESMDGDQKQLNDSVSDSLIHSFSTFVEVSAGDSVSQCREWRTTLTKVVRLIVKRSPLNSHFILFLNENDFCVCARAVFFNQFIDFSQFLNNVCKGYN